MWKTILYFLLTNLALIVLIIGIYAVGFEYDKVHQIYPETVQASYDVSLEGIHGQRWVRFLQIMLTLGAIVDIIVIYIWFKRKPKQKQSLDIL